MVDTIRNWAAAHTQNVLRIRVKQAFDKAGTEMPFRHVKIVRDPEEAA